MSKTYLDEMMESADARRIYQEERAILLVTEQVCQIMDEDGVTKADLANRLGRSRAYITQLLDGRANMTIRTIADVFFALGRSVDISSRALTQGFEGWTSAPKSHWQHQSLKIDWPRQSPLQMAFTPTESDSGVEAA